MSGLTGSERRALETAIDSLTQAVKHEKRGSPHHQILRHYCRGLNLLLPLLASPRCSGRYRDVLRQKCRDYLTKARYFQHLLLSKSDDHTENCLTHDVTTRPQNDASDGDVAASIDVTVPPTSSVRCEESVEGTVSDAHPSTTKPEEEKLQDSTSNSDGSTGKNKKRTTRQVYCEVATVEIPCDDSGDGETEAEAARLAVREAVAVQSLARQFFSEEEMEGWKTRQKELEEEEEEDTRQRRMLQDILDAVFHTVPGMDAVDSWVNAPGVGLEDLQMALKERLFLPLTFPRLFTNTTMRCSPYLLLYGHSGDGLLPVLRTLNQAWGTYLYLVSGRWLLQAVTSGTVKARDLAQTLFSRAFQSAPCALCVTEFDVFGSLSQYEGSEDEDTVRHLKTEMMVHMEQLQRHQDVVIFVAVTSQPWLIESPLRRRFVFRGYCPSPTPAERVAVFMEAMKHIPHSLGQNDLRRIAEKTSLFSRADMVVLADEAHAVLRLRVQEAKYFKPVSSLRRPPSIRDSVRNVSSSPSRSSLNDGENNCEETGQGTECPSRETVQGPSQGTRDTGDEVDSLTEETDEACGQSGTCNLGAEETKQGMENQVKKTEDTDLRYGDQRAQKKSDILKTTSTDCDPSSGKTKTRMTGNLHEEHANFSKDSKKTDNSDDDCESDGFVNGAENGLDCEGACSTLRPQRSSVRDATAESECSSEPVVLYMPCQADDIDSVPMTWLDVEAGSLQEPDVTYYDVLKAIRHMEGEVNEDDVRRLRQWHEDFGPL